MMAMTGPIISSAAITPATAITTANMNVAVGAAVRCGACMTLIWVVGFKGVQRRDVEEYCVSESWIRVQLGKKMDRKGNPLTIKLTGPVEAWFETPAEGVDDAGESTSED